MSAKPNILSHHTPSNTRQPFRMWTWTMQEWNTRGPLLYRPWANLKKIFVNKEISLYENHMDLMNNCVSHVVFNMCTRKRDLGCLYDILTRTLSWVDFCFSCVNIAVPLLLNKCCQIGAYWFPPTLINQWVCSLHAGSYLRLLVALKHLSFATFQ